jgi:hypothetical protein
LIGSTLPLERQFAAPLSGSRPHRLVCNRGQEGSAVGILAFSKQQSRLTERGFVPALAHLSRHPPGPDTCVVLEDTIPANEPRLITVQAASANLCLAPIASTAPVRVHFSLPRKSVRARPKAGSQEPGDPTSTTIWSGSGHCQFVERVWKGYCPRLRRWMRWSCLYVSAVYKHMATESARPIAPSLYPSYSMKRRFSSLSGWPTMLYGRARRPAA